ncbi:hypothetical protein ACX80D_00975 [Arthrobacter sp. Sr24]
MWGAVDYLRDPLTVGNAVVPSSAASSTSSADDAGINCQGAEGEESAAVLGGDHC